MWLGKSTLLGLGKALLRLAIWLVRVRSASPSFQSLSRCINIRSNQGMSIPKLLGQISWQASCYDLPALSTKPLVAISFSLAFSPAFWEAPCYQNELGELSKLSLPLRPPESPGILPLLELSFDQGMYLLQHLHPASA